MIERKVVRYSEAFKLQVVRQLEDGTFSSIEQARRRYGITGTRTVQGWLVRYGRNDLKAKVVRVEKPGEQDQLRMMAQRIRQLEHALAESHMRELLAQGHYHTLCEQMGVEPEGQKKKQPGGPSSTPARGAAPGEG